MGFSGRMPAGKAGAEAAALVDELRELGWLPGNPSAAEKKKTPSAKLHGVKAQDVKTKAVKTQEPHR